MLLASLPEEFAYPLKAPFLVKLNTCFLRNRSGPFARHPSATTVRASARPTAGILSQAGRAGNAVHLVSHESGSFRLRTNRWRLWCSVKWTVS